VTPLGIKQNAYINPRLYANADLVRVTGQFANKPTCGQSSCWLVNSRTSQLAEMF